MLKQLFNLQDKNVVCDLLMALPPKLVEFDTDEGARMADGPPLRVRVTPTEKGENKAFPYERRVSGVQMYICINTTADGGTWGAAAGKGAGIRSEQNSFLDSLNRKETQLPLQFVWLKQGECMKSRCDEIEAENRRQRILAGADKELEEADERTSLFKLSCEANIKAKATALNKITRTPARSVRMNDVTTDEQQAANGRGRTYRFRGSAEQKKKEEEARQAAQRAALLAPGSDAATEWADPALRRIKFDPETYFANTRVDGATQEGYGITVPVDEPTLVRMPCTAPPRVLAEPLWGDLPVVQHSALCILHDAMRCGEHLFEAILEPILGLYEGGTKTAIDEHLNRCLAKMKLRRIATDMNGSPPPSPSHDTKGSHRPACGIAGCGREAIPCLLRR